MLGTSELLAELHVMVFCKVVVEHQNFFYHSGSLFFSLTLHRQSRKKMPVNQALLLVLYSTKGSLFNTLETRGFLDLPMIKDFNFSPTALVYKETQTRAQLICLLISCLYKDHL